MTTIWLEIHVAKEKIRFKFSQWGDFKDFLSNWFKYSEIKEWDLTVIEKGENHG